LVVIVLDFAMFITEGALTCRDSVAGAAFDLALTLKLAAAAAAAAAAVAAVVAVFPEEATPPKPAGCFDCPVSVLFFRGSPLDPALELSLSAFRRAGFFLGLLVAVHGLEGCGVVFLFATGLALLTLFDDDEAGIVAGDSVYVWRPIFQGFYGPGQ
jgi:hypothetical protein